MCISPSTLKIEYTQLTTDLRSIAGDGEQGTRVVHMLVHMCVDVEGRDCRHLSSSIASHIIFESGFLVETGAHRFS